MTVLVLTPSAGGYYFGELLAGLTREVAGEGGRLFLVQTLEVGTRSDEASEPGDFTTPIAWSKVDAVVSIRQLCAGPTCSGCATPASRWCSPAPECRTSTRRSPCRTTMGGPSPQWSTSSALDQYAPTR